MYAARAVSPCLDAQYLIEAGLQGVKWQHLRHSKRFRKTAASAAEPQDESIAAAFSIIKSALLHAH